MTSAKPTAARARARGGSHTRAAAGEREEGGKGEVDEGEADELLPAPRTAMLMAVFTRVLTGADAAVFYSIRRRALDEDAQATGTEPAWMEESLLVLAEWFRTKWSGRDGFFIGAFDSDLAGIIFCGRDGVSSVKVSALYVIPEWRRRGVGRRLLDDAIARARLWPGVKRFWLDVATTNEPARRLYLSRGFHVVGPGEHGGEERMEGSYS